MGGTHIHRFEEFISSRLPELIRGRDTLHVICSTYNQIKDIRPGPVLTWQEGLTVIAHVGGYLPGVVSSVGSESLPEAADALIAIREAQATVVQDGIESETLEWRPVAGTPVLAFVYLGRSAGKAPVKTALKLHQELDADVVLVACDCQEDEKTMLIEPFLSCGDIAGLVFTENCGARAEMFDIIRTIIKLWPERNSPSVA